MVNSLRESFVAPEDPLGNGAYEYRLWLAKKYEPFAQPELVYPTDVFIDPKDATFIAQIQKTIQDYVKSNLAQFVTGARISRRTGMPMSADLKDCDWISIWRFIRKH